MIEVHPHLFVGQDADVEDAIRHNMVVVTCAKHGPYGHARLCGYSPAKRAPDGPERLWVIRGDHLALNVVDTSDPHPEAFTAYDHAVKFVCEQLADGRDILVHCNQGQSRAPSVAFAVLIAIGALTHSSGISEFIKRYPSFAPNGGVNAWLSSVMLKATV